MEPQTINHTDKQTAFSLSTATNDFYVLQWQDCSFENPELGLT